MASGNLRQGDLMDIDGTLQHQILDHLYDGLYVVDQERTIVYWNPAAARLTGYTSEQMVGRHCFDNLLNHVDAAGCSLCQGRCPLVATMGDGDAREALVYLRHQ
ncbi:MAG: PAS domain S-box protein, partial [Thermoanaerobaculia bacterium]|nr:PAS domain S-box protein [Thermoanaerobaculia bacterium]